MVLDAHLASCPPCRARLKREASLRALAQQPADDDDLLPHGEASYTAIASPFGTLWIAADAHGLIRVTYAEDEMTFCHQVESLSRSVPAYRPRTLQTIADQFAAYFEGTRRDFELPLDLRGVGQFRRAVLETTRRVPYGETWSYGEVAAVAGYPGAARAVGTTMATCPFAIVIPCHRVVRSDGQAGRYGSDALGRCGIEYKRALLELERRVREGIAAPLR